MEAYKSKQNNEKPTLSIGDIVILKNDNAKRSFWKLSRIIEFLTGKK